MGHEAYRRASEAVVAEVDASLRVAEGALPRSLRGVLFRNGPGTSRSFDVPYGHPFDGDGHVLRFVFDGERVHYKNRFVRTQERVRELAAGRPVVRSFGTNLPGGLLRNALRMRFKNAANTSVIWHGGRLLALWEGGLPHRLDPETLETMGREHFEGRLLNSGTWLERILAPELPFSAHPKVDPATGELFNFGTLFGPEPRLMLYRISSTGVMDAPASLPLEHLVFLHDFALTARYRVFFLVPVAFRVAAAILGFRSPADALQPLCERPTTVLLVPRDGSSPVMFEASPCFIFHFVGAWERDDDTVEVVGLRMPEFPTAEATRAVIAGRAASFPQAKLTRYVLDLRSGRVSESLLSERACELPTSDPTRVTKPVGAFFSLAGPPGDRDPFPRHVMRFHLPSGTEVVRDFADDLPGEPLLVRTSAAADARQAGTSGGESFVLTLVYRARVHRSDLYVLDAADLSTVCRLELPHHVPPGLHGTWVASG